MKLDEKIITATVLISNRHENKEETLETLDEILHCSDGWEKAKYFADFIVSLALSRVKKEKGISAKTAVLSIYSEIEYVDKMLVDELRKEHIRIFGEDEENDKLIREVKIRSNWKQALLEKLNVTKGLGALALVTYVGYSFTKEDLAELAKVYKENSNLQELIVAMLVTANFHKQASDFSESNLEKYLNDDKIKFEW